jgi:hypothetical protein
MLRIKKTAFWILLVLSTSGLSANGQSITGKIINHVSKEPIPFANIWISGSSDGTSTDLDGNFTIKVSEKSTIHFSSVGFYPSSRTYSMTEHDTNWIIELKPKTFNLKEINIRPDDSYGHSIFKKVVEHKEQNLREIALNKIYIKNDRNTILLASDSMGMLQKWAQKTDLKPYLDTSSGLSYIPIYYIEKESKVEQNQELENHIYDSVSREGLLPDLNKQIESMVLNKIAVEFNFYNNSIFLLDKKFKSPLNRHALLFYNIYLNDSMTVDNTKYYRFSFYPKNKRSTLFIGHFWVESKSFSLKSIDARIAPEANLNFIEQLHIQVKYAQTSTGTWFYESQDLISQISLGSASKDSQLNEFKNGNFVVSRKLSYQLLNDSLVLSDSVFEPQKPTLPFAQEVNIEADIKKLQKQPTLQFMNKMSGMFLSGYYSTRFIDIGPIFDFYSSNSIEGHRITVPFRLGENISKRYTFGAYLGYGSKSEELKYGVSAHYRIPTQNRSILSAIYRNDYAYSNKSSYIQFIKENPYHKANGNLVSAFTSTSLNPFVYQQKTFELQSLTDVGNHLELFIKPYVHQNFGNNHIPFQRDDILYKSFHNTGLMINFRISFDQDYDDLLFARIHYGNAHPVFNLSFDVGQSLIPGLEIPSSDRYYIRSHVSVKHRINLGMMYMRYMANIGFIAGQVPYILLEKPFGNNSLGYSRYDYNLLHHSSFVHNTYANLHLNLNGGGIILGRIPLIKRLNIREMISLKSYYGINTQHSSHLFDIPKQFNSKMIMPYAELGIGMTNIFKVFRIEYVRSISDPIPGQSISNKHGIRMRFEASF